MKTVWIGSLTLAALLTAGPATLCAQQKISAQDFVRLIFNELDALIDHHGQNVADCHAGHKRCAQAMMGNVERDDRTLANLDKLSVPGCAAGLRGHFRAMIVAHRDASAAYAKVFNDPRATEADMQKVEDLQRRERVETAATLDGIVSDTMSACGGSDEFKLPDIGTAQ
jgi:hypothetical protein